MARTSTLNDRTGGVMARDIHMYTAAPPDTAVTYVTSRPARLSGIKDWIRIGLCLLGIGAERRSLLLAVFFLLHLF